MTRAEQDAYRRGQEDMRRRIANRWRGWCVHCLGMFCPTDTKAFKHSRVDVLIRAMELKELPRDPRDLIAALKARE